MSVVELTTTKYEEFLRMRAERDTLRISQVALLKASKEFLEVLPGDLAVSFDDAEKYLALRNAIEAAETQEKSDVL